MKIIQLEKSEAVYLIEDLGRIYLLERNGKMELVLSELDTNRLEEIILNCRSLEKGEK